MREGYSVQSALDGLVRITQLPRHEFWPDSITYQNVQLGRVIGHRQVTDAYLAQLARAHNGRLATLDAGLAALHLDVAELIPVQADGDSNGHTP
jgi:predicted nucleic acid-binding protein